MSQNETLEFGTPPDEDVPTDEKVSPQDVPTGEDVSPSGDEKEESTPGDVSPPTVPTSGGKRIDIKLPPAMRPVLDKLRHGDEKDAAIVKRILEHVPKFNDNMDDLLSENEHLKKQLEDAENELEADRNLVDKLHDDYMQQISQLRKKIEALELELQSKPANQNAVVPVGGQATLDSFGVKDIVEDARDICGDDETCNKVIGKMIDLRAHFASKAMDQEHDAQQRQLDREQKELDRKSREEQAEKERKFRQEQAEREHKNKIELALAKKGGFKQEFLEDVVFLGGGSPKRPKEELDKRKKWAKAASDEEDGGENLRTGLTEGYVGEGEEERGDV